MRQIPPMEAQVRMLKFGASGILIRRGGAILLGQRSADDPSLPGFWCTPGGGVEDGEDDVQAIVREFIEEVGLNVLVAGAFRSWQPTRGFNGIICFRHVVSLSETTPKHLDGFDDVQWFDAGRIIMSQHMITPATFAAILDFWKYKHEQ